MPSVASSIWICTTTVMRPATSIQRGFRPADGVQRGSVQDMTLYAGDPLTPGVGATKKAKRLPISQPRPSKFQMPISYADAQPLLAALEGPVVPAGWRGSLPITYHFDRAGENPPGDQLRLGHENPLRRDCEDSRRAES